MLLKSDIRQNQSRSTSNRVSAITTRILKIGDQTRNRPKFCELPLVLRFGWFWLLPRSNSLFLEKNSLIRVCKQKNRDAQFGPKNGQKPKPSRWPAYTSSAHRKGQKPSPATAYFFFGT